IIVIDDGSTDGTRQVAEGFGPRLTYRARANGGAGAARNSGLELAQGEILCFLDADDLWLPDKTALQLAVLDREPQVDAVFGHTQQFLHSAAGTRELGLPAPAYLPGTMMIRRDAFQRVGAFRTDLKVGEFVDWYARAVEVSISTRMLPETVLRRRIHGENAGIRWRSSTDYLTALKSALDRRRGRR
ncbi:MAG TPA: glycosyltransferase family A protein, partial [Candidatus Binataceae bacterium]|nr:glycosyltransferase family A protein [Candidatus Binataceae bacterium]